MLEKVDQQWLRTFHCVYENLSFKRASECLKLPTSNVSRHIQQLESSLGSRLFDRSTRKISPTCAGERLYLSTRPLLDNLNCALEEVSQHSKEIAGQLRVLMPDSPILAKAIIKFCQKYPSISMCCDTSISPKEGVFDGFDVVLKFHRGRLEDSNLIAREIKRWKSVVVASPELLNDHPAPYKVTDLQHIPCISSLSAINGAPWVFKNARGEIITQTVKSTFKVNSGHLAQAGAISGLGVAILPLDTCLENINSGELKVLDLEYQAEDLVLYAFYASKKHIAKKIPMFIEHLQQQQTPSHE